MGTPPPTHPRFASSLSACQILLINSKFHEGVSVWEALGISEERLGKAPTSMPDPSESNTGKPTEAVSVGGKASGGKEVEDASVQSAASARQRFGMFFESVLGLAMGNWPRVVESCEKGDKPLQVSDNKNKKGKGKVKQYSKKNAMEEEGKKGERRCPGWEGLSFHERIAYVMFMVNVFQVSFISMSSDWR